MPFPLQIRLITPITVSIPKQTNQWEKRPTPAALKDYMRPLGRVGRFSPNPALPTDQPLRGSWCNATSKCMDRYKFVVLPNPYIIKRDWDETRYVLRKIKMQEDTNGPTATW